MTDTDMSLIPVGQTYYGVRPHIIQIFQWNATNIGVTIPDAGIRVRCCWNYEATTSITYIPLMPSPADLAAIQLLKTYMESNAIPYVCENSIHTFLLDLAKGAVNIAKDWGPVITEAIEVGGPIVKSLAKAMA